MDTLDEQILKLIADNARIPFLEVARACNVSGAAIHQRIQKLTNMGVLKGSEYVIDPEKIGYETCAYIGIYLKDPASFDAVTKALEAIPEDRWQEAGFAALSSRYAARCVTLGRRVRALGTEPPLEGIAEAIAPDGALLIRTGDACHPVHAGEVSVRGERGYL